jgi:hypothetical protein
MTGLLCLGERESKGQQDRLLGVQLLQYV